MGTYTWLVGDESISGELTTGLLPTITLNVPAGGIVKRFMIRNTMLMGAQTGRDYNAIAPVSLSQQVQLFRIGHPPKNVFTSSRAVVFEATALYDFETSERIYTQYFNNGDNEFGFDQPCSYGKATDSSGPTIEYQSSLFNTVGSSAFALGYLQYEFAALYYTPG